MFPIMLDLARLRVALVGNGAAALRRLQHLDADGARHLVVYGDDPIPALEAAAGARLRRLIPSAAELADYQIVFAADLAEGRLMQLAATVRALGTLLHVEDRPTLGTVHAPAVIRRGDLVISISTNGKSPGLAKRLKRFLEGLFGTEWQGRLDALADLRAGWREAGADPGEVSRWTEEWVERNKWLEDGPAPPPAPPAGAYAEAEALAPL
ncbi:MAG: siroheme synthase [Alphaproteobacteria bacterium]|nr:siroheme synthase [Alphaproteobacteria bacterium]